VITDYASLKASAIDWTHRTDLASRAPEFVQLAEKDIFRELSLRKIEAKVSGNTTSDTIAIPAESGSLDRLELEANGRKYTIDYTSPNGITTLTVGVNLPCRFTVEEGAIRLLPQPAAEYTYTLFFVPLLSALSDSNPTNWLLTNHPDVYQWGTCLQIAIWSGDAEDKATFEPLYRTAIDSVRRFDDRQRFPASGGLQIKPRSYR
jgi:hypothetical protein